MSKIKMTISRNSNDVINITVVDGLSQIEFLDAEFTLADFARMITGHGYINGTAEYRGLENIDKQLVRQQREIICPLKTYNKTELGLWLIENAQEPGWSIDDYLGSQGSISRSNDKTLLRYSVFKYVAQTGKIL